MKESSHGGGDPQLDSDSRAMIHSQLWCTSLISMVLRKQVNWWGKQGGVGGGGMGRREIGVGGSSLGSGWV